MSNVNESAPKWFVEALATPVETGSVTVDGASIAYRAWGDAGLPGIVLVHGGMAHSRWWDHIAPQLVSGHGRDRKPRHRVVAFDMSGHGDSDHCDEYTLEGWAEQILAVSEAAGAAGRPVVVGHSLGGIVAYRASTLFGDRLDGVVILDSPIRDLTPEEMEMRTRRAMETTAPKVYPTVDAAVSRFRLVPPQDEAEPYVVDHIARTSLKPVDGGVTWKFDSTRVGKGGRTVLDGTTAGTRIAYFRSENGIVDDALLDRMRPMFGPDSLVVELPAAGHHPVFDQPLAVVTAVRTVLAAWDV